MSEKIYFKGKVYHSVSEMDSETRQLFERLDSFLQDQNRDGVPDVIQDGGLSAVKEAFKFMKEISALSQGSSPLTQEQMAIIKESDTHISVNGRSFRGIDEMPPEVRRIYQRVVAKAEVAAPKSFGGEEIFDEPWRKRSRDSYFEPHDDELIEPSYSPAPVQNVMEPVTSNLGLVIAVVLAIVFIAIAALIWISGGNLF